MLDLRSNQSGDGLPKKPTGVGIPEVGEPVVGGSEPRLAKSVQRKTQLKSTGSTIQRRSNDSLALYTAIIGVVIALISGLIALYFAGNERNQAEQSRSEYSSLQTQLNNQPVIGQLSRIRKVSKQIETLNLAGTGATPWPELLDVYSGLVPGAVSITSTSFDSETSLLTIEGEAANHFEVGNFVKSLDISSRFSQPLVLATTFSEDPEKSVVVFTITAKYLAKDQSQLDSTNQSSTQSGANNGQ